MKKNLFNLKNYIFKHKFISFVVLVIVVLISYWGVKSFSNATAQVVYTTGTVKRETVIVSVSGTGQVSALDQVDLKTKASGDITYLNVKVGQEIKAGAYLAHIDSGDVSYEFESAKIAYDELVTIDPNDLRKAEDDFADAKKDVETAYADGQIAVVKASTDLLDNLEIIDGLLSGYLSLTKVGLSRVEEEYIQNVREKYTLADKSLRNYLKNYRTISNKSDRSVTQSLISDLKIIANLALDASKSAKDTVVYLREREDDPSVAFDAYTEVNNLMTSVNSVVTSLSTAGDNIVKNNRALKDAEIALTDLKDGPDTLELRSQKLSLKQKQDALADYSVIAPFAGVIASVEDVSVGDTVSNGTTIATLTTKQKIAEISLNEIDAAKVKTGQKVNLTFDAFDGLNIVGTVMDVNQIGTVSQGVVSYTVKIGFDTQDDRIKSGMSVSASIVIEAKPDVLTVPNGAIKSQGDVNYVEISGSSPDDAPTQQNVIAGISNDTVTEIISGLKEGDFVVVKTTTGTATKTTATRTPSVTGFLGGNRMGR